MTPDQQNECIEILIELTLKDLDDEEIFDLCCEFLRDGFLEYTEDELIKELAAFNEKAPVNEPEEIADEV